MIDIIEESRLLNDSSRLQIQKTFVEFVGSLFNKRPAKISNVLGFAEAGKVTS